MVRSLEELASVVAEKELTVENCISIFQMARRCQMLHIKEASQEYIFKNFTEILRVAETSFLSLTVEQIKDFVFSGSLRATESEVFKAIVTWIEADLPERLGFASELLSAVRVHRCTLSFLCTARKHSLVQTEAEFLSLVNKRIEELSSGTNHEHHFFGMGLPKRPGDRFLANVKESIKESSSEALCANRLVEKELARARDIIFVVVGSGKNRWIDTGDFKTLDPSCDNSWVYHPVWELVCPPVSIFSLGHKVLVMGLCHGGGMCSSYDTVTMKWNKLSKPPPYSYGMFMAQEGINLYVFGGEGRPKRSDRYNVETDYWETIPPMREGRSHGAAASHAGKIYCCGGKAPSGQILSSMEVYNPRSKERSWSPVQSMQVARHEHCVVSHGEFLFAIGGKDGSNILTAVERFDISSSQWSTVCPLLVPRSRFGAMVHDGLIYAIGGFTNGSPGSHILSSVEVYNILQDSWTPFTSLCTNTYGDIACVVKSLPDADRYGLPAFIPFDPREGLPEYEVPELTDEPVPENITRPPRSKPDLLERVVHPLKKCTIA